MVRHYGSAQPQPDRMLAWAEVCQPSAESILLPLKLAAVRLLLRELCVRIHEWEDK